MSATPEKAGTTLDHQAAELFDAMSALIRVYQFRDRDRTYCHGVSVSQCYALEAIDRAGPLTINEIAAHLYLSKSTVSRLVDGMISKDLVTRETHPDDRRACLVGLTAVGSCVHRQILDEYLERERELLEEFDPRIRPDLIEFVRRLGETAAASAESGFRGCD